MSTCTCSVGDKSSTTHSALPLAYRINEVHRAAPWGRSTTYELVRTGKLPARKLGSATFILTADLLEFVEGCELVGSDL